MNLNNQNKHSSIEVNPSNTSPDTQSDTQTDVQTKVDAFAAKHLSIHQLDNLMNIEQAFQKTRLIAILSLAFSFLFCVIVMVIAMNMVTKGKGKIYITNGYGNTLEAYQIGANENRRAEAKAQVRNFHAMLYHITPNPEAVKDNLDQLLLIGDGSVKAFLDKRGDSYYKKLIASDVEVKFENDSLKVNTSIYPYKAVQYGKEIVQTSVGFLIKNLVTSCELKEVARTDENPHGLLISNFEVLKNERQQFVELKK